MGLAHCRGRRGAVCAAGEPRVHATARPVGCCSGPGLALRRRPAPIDLVFVRTAVAGVAVRPLAGGIPGPGPVRGFCLAGCPGGRERAARPACRRGWPGIRRCVGALPGDSRAHPPPRRQRRVPDRRPGTGRRAPSRIRNVYRTGQALFPAALGRGRVARQPDGSSHRCADFGRRRAHGAQADALDLGRACRISGAGGLDYLLGPEYDDQYPRVDRVFDGAVPRPGGGLPGCAGRLAGRGTGAGRAGGRFWTAGGPPLSPGRLCAAVRRPRVLARPAAAQTLSHVAPHPRRPTLALSRQPLHRRSGDHRRPVWHRCTHQPCAGGRPPAGTRVQRRHVCLFAVQPHPVGAVPGGGQHPALSVRRPAAGSVRRRPGLAGETAAQAGGAFRGRIRRHGIHRRHLSRAPVS